MSDLDDAMLQRIIHIVYDEHNSFSHKDFLDLMKPKTFRNKISKLKKDGIVELDNKSTSAFYTLKDHKFGKAGTRNHTRVTISHNDPVYQMIKNLPMDKQSIHDIRLRFSVPSIWKMLSDNPKFHRNNRSKDIIISSWRKDNAIVGATIHKTDTVSVTIGCSLEPIPLDFNGIIRFFTILARSRERLEIVLDSSTVDWDKMTQSIPDYGKWIITMWHFGRDGLLEYAGEKFWTTIANAQHILTRVYSKEL